MTPTPSHTRPRHPAGLYILFLTEMWERFSFYLMIGILYQYLVDSQTGGMGWSGEKAASVVGSYIGLVYFTPFLGGLVADRLLGSRTTIILGAAFMVVGHVLLAFPTETMLYLALLTLIIGCGLFKANISTMVGNLYPPGSPLRDSGYNIFYLGINVGAFLCNFVAALVRNAYGWHWAFATAGIGMAIGLVTFAIGQRYLRDADRNPRERPATEHDQSLAPLIFGCLLPAVVCGTIGWFVGGSSPTMAFLFASVPAVGFFVWVWRSIEIPREKARVAGLLTIFAVSVPFWAIFQQNSTALTAWALSSTDRTPNAVVKPIINLSPDFAENAPPEYFKNAGPTTPRPDKSTFQIVGEPEYEALQKNKLLAVTDGKPVMVTALIQTEVYALANAETPILPPGQHLKLVNTELFQSINGGFIILFTPLVVGFFGWLRRRNKEPSTSAKIGMGLGITALSAVVMIIASMVVDDVHGKATAWWLFGTYGVITIGELCLSPMGLSLVSRMSPVRMRAFMMGGWFLSTAIGNKLSGILGEVYHKWSHVEFFVVNAIAVGVAALVVLLLLPWLNQQMVEDRALPAADAASDAA